jgi:hypothetical protein
MPAASASEHCLLATKALRSSNRAKPTVPPDKSHVQAIWAKATYIKKPP